MGLPAEQRDSHQREPTRGLGTTRPQGSIRRTQVGGRRQRPVGATSHASHRSVLGPHTGSVGLTREIQLATEWGRELSSCGLEILTPEGENRL